MPNRQQKLARAVRILSKYYGIHTTGDLAERIALDNLRNTTAATGRETPGGGADGNSTVDVSRPTEAEARLINLLIDTADGTLTTTRFIQEVENAISNDSAVETQFGKLLQMHYEPGKNFVVRQESPEAINTFLPPQYVLYPSDDEEQTETVALEDVGVRQMLGYPPAGNGSVRLNQTPSSPTPENPGLSVYISNSPRVSLESQNVNASTIFMNGIPSVELARAMPFVNVEFLFSGPAKSDIGGRLQNLSLNKFLLGAVKPAAGSPLDIMAEADTTTGTAAAGGRGASVGAAGGASGEEPQKYTRAGMELFTAPQTLVNADDDTISTSARANPVLDKFRPLMTLQDFTLRVEPSRGLMSFKRGTLSFILHDRSRLPEVANFVRADLYGRNEISIEYGWSHPDGESDVADNPYGDLINGLRMKEKYMVQNSSFTFDPAGQVIITLNIFTRGSTEFNTELMSSDSESYSNAIREIEELQRTIFQLRQRTFPAGTVTAQTEIRGRQILDAAQDALSNPVLTSDLREALTDFRRAYRDSANPNARELLSRIEQLYGDQVQQRRQRGRGQRQPPGQPTAFRALRRSIQESIRRKVQNLQITPDPFLPNNIPNEGRRFIQTTVPRAERRAQRAFRQAFRADIESDLPVSLGKLLLSFVGEPLANTGNYDEVQMFFYPFNEYAGRASSLNIANYTVDMEYFADELARYRLDHISRTSVMSLRAFMNFIADTLVDDPASPSYGLVNDDNSPLYRVSYPDEDGAVRGTRPVEDNPANFQIRLERALQGVTPDGSFRPPEIGIYVETLPEKVGFEDGEDADETSPRSILRIHVYDKVATTYGTLGRLLITTRREELRAISRLPNVRAGNQSVVDNRLQIAGVTLRAAENLGLIEFIPEDPIAQARQDAREGRASPTGVTYRIVGGAEKLKEFIMLNSPYIIFGAGGTTVKSAQLATMQDSAMSSVNILRSFRREEGTTPAGENLGGLPLQIIPTQLSLECVGNPLINYLQTFFVDFQTGTTADNLYRVLGIDHKFIQGDFTTSIRFGPDDAWGNYRSLISTVGNSIDVLREAVERANAVNGAAQGAAGGNNNSPV